MRLRILLLLLFLAANAAIANVMEAPLDSLHPTPEHRNAARIIIQVIDRYHYREAELDDRMSEAIFDRYLETLDLNRSFFTRKDLERFGHYRERMDDALQRSRLEPAFEIFRLFRQRVDRQVAKALQYLHSDLDFDREESYRFDREDADWVADQAELDSIWRQRVKNDILTLRLSGKPEDEIVSTLAKRYEGIARRTRQLTADDVFQAFINAYTLSLEPHTSYMSPRTAENFDISMRLSLEGIGAVLSTENEYTKVQSVIAGGPAAKSGQVKGGDRIVGVAQDDGEMVDVVGWRLQDVVELIRGPKGSRVRLSIKSKNSGPQGPVREISLIRDKIKLEDQAAKKSLLTDIEGLAGARIGVIELPAFYRDFAAQARGDDDFRSTTRDVRKLLEELKQEGVDGIVIDLRRNGGGSLSEATELTGLFIDTGPVVQVRDATGHIDVEEDEDAGVVYDGPLAVLVDRNSASASEIFAGAIQDYRRGIIIGEPTFGKGTVQTLVDLGRFVDGDPELGRLRLTMAQFFRINGGSTQHRGVVPDIVFPTARWASDHGERALDNALPWDHISPLKHASLGAGAVAQLRERNQQRVSADPGFQFLASQEETVAALRDRHTVSLREADREQEWQAQEEERLAIRNRFREALGLTPLTSNMDEDAADAADEEDDENIRQVVLNESARILADFVHVDQLNQTREASVR